MRRLNLTVLAGLVVAVLGFGTVFAYGTRVDDRVAEGRRTVPVLLATDTLPAGTAPADLVERVAVTQVPAAYVAEGALTSTEALAALLPEQVLRAPLTRGAQLTAASFGDPAEAAQVVPSPGRVALAVGVPSTPGVASHVVTGSTVDVFVTYPAGEDGQPVTKLFQPGVRVLSVGAAGAQGASADGSVVTVLDLAPAEAERVVNAATTGQLYLALANPQDAAGHATTGTTPADVLRTGP